MGHNIVIEIDKYKEIERNFNSYGFHIGCNVGLGRFEVWRNKIGQTIPFYNIETLESYIYGYIDALKRQNKDSESS